MNLQVGVKVLIEKNGKYLFLRRSQAFKPGPQKWDIPGGRIEPDEPLSEALEREVREETHLSLGGVTGVIVRAGHFCTGQRPPCRSADISDSSR